VTLRRLTIALLVGAMAAVALPTAAPAAYRYGARVMKMGSKGKDVRRLQRNLTTLGYDTPADGVYGLTTKRNVKSLERKRAWKVDGKVSRKDASRIAKLVAKRASKPSTLYFVNGLNKPTISLSAARAGAATVEVEDVGTGAAAATIPVSFTSAGSVSIPWNGTLATGAPAPESDYRLKLSDPGTAQAAATAGTKQFMLRVHDFPVQGDHGYGGSASRFGAGRSDHIHQGQDMSAACGTPLAAAAGGKILANAYQAGGAGNYVVIQGAATGTSYVYMHMKKPSWAVKGTTVYAGQIIGKVGTTGSSTGCHLHFERWTKPGWYLGGHAYDPLPELKAWDAYS
jgi:murein DD-endopeptidase MepM/ murein hydrolase activator NlpD